ncbi:MAG: aminotransferase class I/II-fold pyridoxal phosphate-dependent enzyme [Faecalibacterium sp.]|nr:aminotransferase class I/II-fold pyridoxal phosphate-dependent enzyme [Faecalibacterium sp.]
MADYFAMSTEQLLEEQQLLRAEFLKYKNMGLQLNMARGKPCTEKLDLSKELLKMDNYIGEDGFDARNYGLLEGMPEARRFFADLLSVDKDEVVVGGNSALQMIYYMIDLGWRQGFVDSPRPWRHYNSLKFLCPVPGYDRHFRITEYFGFQMINIPMTETGPDMDMVEALVKRDDTIKGIWCVPVYSNPDGYTYSAETVRRLARMQTAAPDFKIIWDNAYIVHHLTDEKCEVPSLLYECQKAGHSERPLTFCSTSKITYPGAGVAALAASERSIKYITKNMMPMIISFDKMNQLRHVQYFKNREGVLAHMEKHRAILAPKFDLVKRTFEEELTPCGKIARWTDPKGGYFISLYLQEGCAKRTVQMCKDAGVILTGAGAAYPYGLDPKDSHLRIAPTYPSLEELETAAKMLTVCVRLATVEVMLKNRD